MPEKIYCVSYADDRMTIAQKKLEESFMSVPHRAGLQRLTMSFHTRDIDPDFVKKNQDIFAQERGAGYWLWKPWVILEALNRIADGDYVIYIDAGIEVMDDISYLLEGWPEIILFENTWPHIDWCKGYVLKGMLSTHGIPDRNYKQCQASVCVFRKTPVTIDFVEEWLTWCQVDGFIDDSPCHLPEIDSFREHRHDQAILTNLCLIHNIPRHWWPSRYHEGFRSLYPADAHWPVLFFHHRKRNNEW